MSEQAITVFCGEPIDEMSREELIEALKTVGRAYEELLRERADKVVDGRYIRFGNIPL